MKIQNLFFSLLAWVLFLPLARVSAQGTGSGGTGTSSGSGGTGTTPGTEGDLHLNFKVDNPIGVDNIGDFIKEVLNVVLMIAIPVIALAIIYSGFLFVKARGNPGELEKAKQALLYTVIGAAIILGAWVLAQAIGETIGQLKA